MKTRSAKGRRRFIPSVASLEERALLTVSPVAGHVLVADIDTSFNVNDPDLAGVFDMQHAYDIGDNIKGPGGSYYIPGDDHGTGVSKNIAGQLSNVANLAGYNPGVQILPIQVRLVTVNGQTGLSESDILTGIQYAINMGASVINLSFGGPGIGNYDPDEYQLIAQAGAAGIVVVAGAGNNGVNTDTQPFYPADYGLPNMISVANVDGAGHLQNSNYGPTTVTLGAPGAPAATSFATGYVSGVIGGLAGQRPEWTPAQLINRVKSTVTVVQQPAVPGQWSVTNGVINPQAAVNGIVESVAINAGSSSGAGVFVSDRFFTSTNGSNYSTTAPIDTSGVVQPAPTRVYQTERYGNFTYTIPNLVPNRLYTVKLDFAEIFNNGPGQRTFSVAINGTTVLSNFDVFAAAGGANKAVNKLFTATSSNTGTVTIAFTAPPNNNAAVKGIELYSVLAANQPLYSPNGQYQLLMQTDGNLVEYGPNGPLWSSRTGGNPGAQAVMQSDGNLVIYAANGQPIWSSGTGGHPGAYLAVQNNGVTGIYEQSTNAWIWTGNSISEPGHALTSGQSIYSPNTQYQLIMQTDGNLVEYGPSGAIWASGTGGNPGAQALMQTDGNLVVYAANGAVLWSTQSYGNTGAFLKLQNDGNAVIYQPANGAIVWSGKSVAMQGRVLNAGQSLFSLSGQYELAMQTDGNLVVYGPSGAIWSSATGGHPGAKALMQSDGNLVIYAANGAVLWSTNTGGHPGAYLIIQNDGKLRIIYQGNPIWTT